MSASRPPLSSRPVFLPDEIARREFASAFRGYEPAEVRTFLTQISEQFADLADRVAEMQVALSEQQDRGDNPELDEETVTRLLGEQTAQILRSAREAAKEMRAKAEEEVSVSLRDAHEAATRMRTEAETFHTEHIAEAEATAKRLREESQQEADTVRTSAYEEAENARNTANEEAAAVRAEITEEAERTRAEIESQLSEHEAEMTRRRTEELESARAQGREIIDAARAEAQSLVERTTAQQSENLDSILRKRAIAVAQIEELRAGRQRLLEAYKMVRSTLDDVTSELERVESEARNAAGAAGITAAQNSGIAQEELDTVIELETYTLEDDVSQSVIDLVQDDSSGEEQSPDNSDDESRVKPGGGSFFDGASAFDDDDAGDYFRSENENTKAGLDLTGSRDPNNVATPLDLREEPEPVVLFPQDKPSSANTGGPVAMLTDTDQETEAEIEVIHDDEDFLKEERERGPRLTSSFIIGESAAGAAGQDDYRVTMRRSAAVTKNRPQAVRRLRRVLQDEQDAVIAQLRGGMVASPEALLGSVDTQASTYQRAVVRLFREVVRAGASSVEGSIGVERGAIDHAGNDAARYMSIELVEDLRSQLVPVLEELISGQQMPDPSSLQALVGGPYRVVSGDYLEQLVEDRIGGAFDHGVEFAR